MRGDLQIIEDVGNMNGSDSRPSTGPDEPLPGQLANRGGGRGGGNKYASTPDVRNAVMDYYRSDTKSNKNSNLSALMTSAKPGPMDFDDFGGGGGGGGGYGGGESVITLEEFQDLKRAFQTMVEAQASQKRGARFKIDWKWYHILLLIVFNDIVLIAVGMAIGSAFYGVGPLVGGSFTADAIQVEEMSVLPERGEAHGLLHSVDGSSKLDLRSHTGNIAQISLGDHESNDNAIFNMLATTRSGMTPALEIREGYEARIAVLTNSRGTDIALNPYDRGKVYVNGDLGLTEDTISTNFSNLVIAPAFGKSLHLTPSARAPVVIHNDMTIYAPASIGTMHSNLEMSAAFGKNITLGTMNATVDVVGDLGISGNAKYQGNMYLKGSLSSGGLVVDNKAVIRGDVTLGGNSMDAISFDGHIKSCGTLPGEMDECSSSKIIFDANDDGFGIIVNVPDPPAEDGVNFRINFPAENGQVLTSVSKQSDLEGVGALSSGSIVAGFGSAEVSGLTSRGSSNLYGDVTMGISLQNEIEINGHISSRRFVFDRDGDAVRYIIGFPDPSDTDFQERVVEFPLETGTVLTTASAFSTLEAVGAMSQGSLVTGFGSAEVSNLLSTGFSHLSRDSQIGTTSSDELEISAHITSTRLVFDANSDSATITLAFPDPLLISKTIDFPDETGQVITTASDFSTLTAVGELTTGSLGPGFGSAHVASLISDGDSYLRSNVRLGLTEPNTLEFYAHVITSTIVFDANSDGINKLTLFMPDPTQPRTIEFPQEDGRLLTTSSTDSALETVGDLRVGNIVSGFGSAEVTDLTTTGDTNLNGPNVFIGDAITDFVQIRSRIQNEDLVIKHPTAVADLTLQFPRPLADITISYPDETGLLLTDVSANSALEHVAALSAGSIVDGFGDITVSSDIATIGAGSITAAGHMFAQSSVQLGSVPEHEVTIRGTVEVRGGANTVFSIDPMDGNTYIEGNIEIGGSIQALSAPFFVNAIKTSSIGELIADSGVNIEGIVFKDGGFEFAKTDEIAEYTEGQGVLVDGVLMRDGGVIAEASIVSANPVGSIDLVTLVNDGRDYEMRGTHTNLKFRQYFQATPDVGSFAVDSGAITVGTESNWNEARSSRHAFMGFSTVENGDLEERVHISANGDYAVNADQLTITKANADVKMVGNVTIGEGQTGPKRLLVNSDDSTSILDVTSGGGDAIVSVISGPASDAQITMTGGNDRDARMRFVDPSPTAGAMLDLILVGNAPDTTMRVTDGGDITLYSVVVDQAKGVGNMNVTGHLDSVSATIATVLATHDFITYNQTQLGDNRTDQISIFGHLTMENLTVDVGSDDLNTVTLYFPEPSQSRTIEYPDEDGRLLTTVSNYSTLTAVATLIEGNIADGFGYADFTWLNVKDLTTLNSDITFGDGLKAPEGLNALDGPNADGLNINAHVREELIFFDANSDNASITFEIPDPTLPFDDLVKYCSTWDGTLLEVHIGWPYDDVRPIDWDNITGTFPLVPEIDAQLVIYNTTERRDYSWVNCGYNYSIWEKISINASTEVRDSSMFSCRDYHDYGYTCNDLVYIFGYDCASTCVAATLEDDVGDDTGYGWLSLEDALIMHRDYVRYTIESSPSFNIAFPNEQGTVILSQCGADSSHPDDETFCETFLPGTGNMSGGHGDLYLGRTKTDRIFIPGLIYGFFTVMGTILSSGLKQWGEVLDRASRPLEMWEVLRFKQSEDDAFTMTLTVENQTADQYLAFPDETGYLLSSSSAFSTLNTVGILTGLEVAGDTKLNANVAIGDDAADKLAVNASIMSDFAMPTSGSYSGATFTGFDFTGAATENLVVTIDGTPQSLALTTDITDAADAVLALAAMTDAVAAEDLSTVGATEGCTSTLQAPPNTVTSADTTNCVLTSGTPGNCLDVNSVTATCAYVARSGNLVITSSSGGPSSTVTIDAASGANAAALFGAGTVLGGYLIATDARERAMTFEGSVHDGMVMHLAVAEPQGVNTVTIPDESGLILTDVSNISTLTAVGDMTVGSLAQGFGAAYVESLTTDGQANLLGNTTIGDAPEDTLTFGGTVVGGGRADNSIAFVFQGPEADLNNPDAFDLTLNMAQFTASRTVTLPDIDGNILTDESVHSILEHLGPVNVGSLVTGFGDAEVEVLRATSTTFLDADVFLGRDAAAPSAGTFTGSAFTGYNFGSLLWQETLIVVVDGGAPQSMLLASTATTIGDAVTMINALLVNAVASDSGGVLLLTTVSLGTSSTVTVTASGSGPNALLLLGAGGAGAAVTGTDPISSRTPIDIGGRIVNGRLFFDETGGGSTTLVVPEPVSANQYLHFPTLDGPFEATMLTDESRSALALQEVGALEMGSITEGFGEVRTNNDVHLLEVSDTADPRYGDKANLAVAGDVTMSQRTFFSQDAGLAQDPVLSIPDDRSIYSILDPMSGATGTDRFLLPACGSSNVGQLLVINNEHRYTMLSADAAGTANSAVPDIDPHTAATHYCIRDRWVQTSTMCTAYSASACAAVSGTG